MREALYELVTSAEYRHFNFDNDIFAPRLETSAVWDLMKRIVKAAGPILLLLRLADSNAATLCKLKGTVEYIKTLMVGNEEDSLEDNICAAFLNRAPDLDCDISNAAYILDPQFVTSSRRANAEVMTSFWEVSQNVLRITDETDWRRTRQQIVSELAQFRMQTGGFALEDYDIYNTCAFWGAAGCHAPLLQKLAYCLTALPCSSGEAERNWQEVKQNMTKKRNRLSREKVEKMVFVRRFTRLKWTLFSKKDKQGDNMFNAWIKDLLHNAKRVSPRGKRKDCDLDYDESLPVFHDVIEPGEQGKINGKEPGQPVVSLTTLKKNNTAKSWLFEKYYNMCFLDKNPEGDAGCDPLADEQAWEHRIILNIVWWRNEGFSVQTALYGEPETQSLEKYLINSSLLQMIRDSPHNERPMFTQIDDEDDDDVDLTEDVDS